MNLKDYLKDIELVIFDLWGTLIKETSSFSEAINQISNIYGIRPSQVVEAIEECLMTNNPSIDCAIEKIAFKTSMDKESLKKLLLKALSRAIIVYEDASIIDYLKSKGYKTAILSNTEPLTPKESVPPLLMVDKAFISGETGLLKPDKKAFLTVTQHFNVKPEKAVMIGDSLTRDYLGALSAGLKALLLDRQKRYQGYTPYRIENLLELKNYL